MPRRRALPTLLGMEIRSVDVHDDTEFHAFHEIVEAASRHERPLATLWSEQEAAVMFRQHDGVMSWEAHGVFEDGVMVGAAHALFPLHDNLDKVYFEVHVAPGDRGRGYGSALVGHVVDRARDRDRTVLVGESHFPADADESHPHRRFAAKHGFDLANTEMHRVLELPVDDALLRTWAEEAAAHHEGYAVTTHVGGPPEALLPSYVHLLNQLALDAPTGDIDFEEEALTVAAYRTRLERTRAQGRTLYVTVATVGEGDAAEAVAHSVLVVPAAGVDEPNVYQWATLVRRDHRGHHLGMATKAHNLRAVQRAHPDRRRVHTSNSEVNGPMVAINERIGFRPVEVNAEFLRRIG